MIVAHGNIPERARRWGSRLWRSIWLFPALLTLVLLGAAALEIHGSSIGSYHRIFYGGAPDPNRLKGEPRPIRSDEWLVNTQMMIAQQNNDFARINQNIGQGEDVSMMIDVPYRDWSIIFKPQNLAYFVMAPENAFAFRWWFMGYLLILSAYFFVLAFLPGRRLLAALVGTALFLSPFVQWWYLYGTLASIYYSLFCGVILVQILKAKRLGPSLLWGALLAYVIACFALVLYPPFQIACGLMVLVAGAAHLYERLRKAPGRVVAQKLGILAAAVAIAGTVAVGFLLTRMDVVRTVGSTAYPGHRIAESGGFDAAHAFSGHLMRQLQSRVSAGAYHMPAATNQSEASNFLLLLPFLALPSLALLLVYYRREKKIDWPLALANGMFELAMVWMFVPHLDILGKVTLLDRVPPVRLLIGLGVLNVVMLVLFMRRYAAMKDFVIRRRWVALYAFLVLVAELALAAYAMRRSPGFIGIRGVIAFSLPVPIMMYLLLRKRFVVAAAVLVAFSAFMALNVNPLYRGTDILTETPISQAIKSIASREDGRWAADNIVFENFALMNGARSLSGVYTYPQLELWRGIDPEVEEKTYNRYAHISFVFDRRPTETVPTSMKLLGADNIAMTTEPCGDFLRRHEVRFLLVSDKLHPEEPCVTLVEQVSYPMHKLHIYRINDR